MGYLFVAFAVFAENAGKIFDKYNFEHTQVTPKETLRLVFGVMATAITVFVLLTRPELPALSSPLLLSLALVVALSFISNVFDETSLKINPLSLREPLSNFHPILAGFIGYLLFPEERSAFLLLALILGAFIVSWGIKPAKLAKAQKLGIACMVLSVLAESALTNVYVVALENTSPEYIALVRSVFIFLLLAIVYQPKKRNYKTKNQARLLALTSGIFYSVGAIISLYAIEALGVVTTMLLLLVGPALRYLSAFIFLKDKPNRHELISSCLLGLIAILVAFI